LKIRIEYGKIRDECSNKNFSSDLHRKEETMGKSLEGKELGNIPLTAIAVMRLIRQKAHRQEIIFAGNFLLKNVKA